MPTRDGYPEGVPSWADLDTTDLETAKAFYADLFGWEYSDQDSDSTPYSMALKNGHPAAGMAQTEEDQSFSVWTTYFAVDDVDATAARIESEGGTLIFAPADVTDAGRLAVATDPTGAVFGIWQSGRHFGAGIVNEHGGMNWNELQSDDLASAIPFYERVLGFTSETSEGLSGPYTSLKVGGRAVAGAMSPPNPDIPNNWGVYFAVDDVGRAKDIIVEAGGRAIAGPMEIPDVGTLLVVADPTGAVFTLIQLAMEID